MGASYRSWWSLDALLALGAAFGPPLTGAASTLSWSYAADGNTAQQVARLLYARAGPNRTAEEHWNDRRIAEACEGRFAARLGEEAVVNVISAMHASRIEHRRSILDGLGVDALTDLPAPLLGALDWCSGGSLLRPLCTEAVLTIGQSATERPRAEIERELVEVDRRFDRAWCAIAPAGQAR